jgi:MFS family permease
MSVFARLVLSAIPMALTWTLAFFGVFCFVNGYVKRELGLGTEVWTQLTIWLIGGVVFWQAVAAEVSARIGRRRALVGAMAMSAAAYAAIPFVHDPRYLGPLLAVLGVMHGVFFGVWFPFVAAAGRAAPGRSIAGTQLVFNCCSLLGILVGAPVMAAQNFRLLFFVGSGIMFLSTVSFAVLASKLEEGGDKVTSIWRLKRADIKAVLHGPFLWIAFAGLMLEPFGFHTVNNLFPNLAREWHGFGEGQITVSVSVMRIPALMVLLVLTQWIDRLNATRCYALGLLLGGVGVMGMGLAPQPWVLLLLLSFYYGGQGIVWGSNSTTVNRMVPADLRDAAFALMGMILMLSMLAVGVIHDWLANADVPLPRLFAICGVFGIVSGTTLLVRAGRLDGRTVQVPSEA